MTLRADIVLFGVLLLGLGYAHQRAYQLPTPMSRLALLHAILEDRTLDIDRYHLRTCDKAFANGHYFSDKAPGTILVALPPFIVSSGILRLAGLPLDSPRGWFVSSWFSCFWALAIPTAVGGVALYRWLSQLVPMRPALVTTVTFVLGAAPLPYATQMFSHSLVVGLCWVAVYKCRLLCSGRPSARQSVIAGGALGLALASEFSAGIVIAALLVAFLRWHSGVGKYLAVGFAVPLLLVPAYNWACCGSPWILPYTLHSTFPEMQTGLYGIRWPSAETMFNLLAGPTRGLLLWCPFLVTTLVGLCVIAKNGREWLWLFYGIPMLHVIVMSGRSWDWQAGPTLGPRFLVCVLPIIALPCALGTQRLPRVSCTLAFLSLAITTLATLTDACPGYSIYNPLTELHIPLLISGQFSPNLGMVLGLPPYASVTLYYAILMVGMWWLWRRSQAEPKAPVQKAALSP